MINTRTFNYTFCSAQSDFTVTGAFAESVFTMDALPEKDYFVQCTAFMLDSTGLGAGHPEFVSLVGTNLSMDRGFTMGLNSNQTLLASISTTQNAGSLLTSGEGSVFRMTDCNMKREIKFGIYDMGMNLLDNTIIPDTSDYVFTLQFTPVKEPF